MTVLCYNETCYKETTLYVYFHTDFTVFNLEGAIGPLFDQIPLARARVGIFNIM